MFTAIAIAAVLQTASPWLVNDRTSPLDGRRSVSIGIESREGVGNAIGRLDKPMLAITCSGGVRGISIWWPRYLGRAPIVEWKFDQGQVQSSPFDVGQAGQTAALHGRAADRFLDELGSAQQVALRAVGQDVVFDVTGAGEQVAKVREACPGR